MRTGEELFNQMKSDLGLTGDQAEKLKNVIREYVKHVKEAKASNSGDSLKETLKPVKKKRNKMLRNLLNEDQFAKLKANRANYKGIWKKS